MHSRDTTSNRDRLLTLLPIAGIMLLALAVGAAWLTQVPQVGAMLYTPSPTVAPTSTSTPIPTFTPTPPPPPPTSTPAPPTATATRVVNYTATAQGRIQTPQADESTQANLSLPINIRPKFNGAPVSFSRNSRLVLAHYFAWYDGHGWDACNISAGDKPLEPYHSDDPAAIARHVHIAREIGLNGFTLHWFAPRDRTDRNFGALLAQSEGSDFASTIVFSHHIWHGRPRDIPGALRYVIEQHAAHPNFLRLAGKPVIFFTDVYRTPGKSPQQYWAEMRQQVDPQHQTVWIAEGLDPSYLDVFDGLYVFKITHAAYPHDYQKSATWGNRVRQWAQQTGQPKLWIGTITSGWDDLRSGCKPDVRVDNTSHRLDRDNGAVYESTFSYALQSNPDWLIVGSFNEWVEGTYIEPSEQYGDKYMQMTKEFVQQFRDK